MSGYYYVTASSSVPVGPYPTAAAALHAEQRAAQCMAMDKATAREFDVDGRLRVARTHISKANVCPYKGSEIPGWRALGLDPDKVYQLYRAPEELAKAASTFNGVPVLSEHVPVTVDIHRPELVVGYTGTDAVFEDPYLDNSLFVITREAIDGIEDESKKELSCAYRYRADMTSGQAPDGTRYDGVMRNIVANHVALVKEGRAGPDIVVGDSITKELAYMSKSARSRMAMLAHGALLVALPPMLAKDAKPDLNKILQDVTAKNLKEKTAGIAAALKSSLAQDANVEDLTKLLDGLSAAEVAEVEDEDPAMKPDDPEGKVPGLDDGMNEKLAAFLRDKLGPDDLASAMELMKASGGEEKPEAPKKPGAEDEEDKDMVSKKDMETAMDSAMKSTAEKVRAEVLQNQRDIRTAEKTVQPYVGVLEGAFDSAEQVYRTTLDMLGVDHKAVKDPAALPVILKAQPLPGAKKAAAEPVIAADEAAMASYDKMFPQAAKIGALG